MNATELQNTLKPWQRQPGETAKAFSAFIAYRDTPSAERVARRLAQPDQGWAMRSVERWSVQHRWADRAKAYDEHLDEIASAAREKALAERRIELVDQELEGAAKQRQRWLEEWERAEQCSEIAPIGPAAWELFTRWLERIIIQERRALGMPDRVTNQQATGAGGKDMVINFHMVAAAPPLDEDNPDEHDAEI